MRFQIAGIKKRDPVQTFGSNHGSGRNFPEKDGIFYMKRVAKWELALLVGLMVSLAWGCWAERTEAQLSQKVVRLHVLANSDSEADQALKLKVRDSVLETASAVLEGCLDRETAEQRLSAALPEIEDAARARIAAEGETQAVTAELRPTAFPTREYEDFSLPAGDYLALRVVLGEGEGHNWWCVVFPPLCAETTSDLSQTAMAAGLTEDDIALITESDGYQLKFKAVELWGRLKAYFS